MTGEEKVIKLEPPELDIGTWTVPEARLYRKAVGVNPEYAGKCIEDAFAKAEAEAEETFGAAVDEEGWEPPDDWTPKALLDFDPDYLLGFHWIPAHRKDPELDYEAFAAGVPYVALLESFWALVTVRAEEAAPLAAPNRAARRRTSSARKPRSGSAAGTAGPSATSTASPSKKSRRPSPTRTSASAPGKAE